MVITTDQIELPLAATKRDSERRKSRSRAAMSQSTQDRVAGMDQVLGTHDVERITGKHRCTIYRWVVAGTFPAKRAGGGRGWLRSDVEKWLSQGPGSQIGPLDGPSHFSDRS